MTNAHRGPAPLAPEALLGGWSPRARADRLAAVLTVGMLGSLLLSETERGARSVLQSWLEIEIAPAPRRGLEIILWCLVAITVARSSPAPQMTRRTVPSLLAATLLVHAVALSGELHGTGLGLTSDIWLIVPLLATLAIFDLSSLLEVRRLLTLLIGVALPFVLLSLAAGLTGSEDAFLGLSDRVLGSPFAQGRLRGLFAFPLFLAAVGGLLLVLSCARLTLVLDGQTRGAARRTAGAAVLTLSAAAGGTAIVAADGLSATGAVGAAIAATVLAVVARPSRWSLRTQRVVAAAAGVSISGFAFVLGALELGSLTGRVHLWSRILATLTPQEWSVGFGARPLSRGSDLFDRLNTYWGAVHGHNQSVDLLLEVGLIGPVVTAILATNVILAGMRATAVSRGWSLGVAVYFVMLWLTEVIVTGDSASYRFVTLGVLLLLFAWGRRPETQSPPRQATRVHRPTGDARAGS
jgi:hypothetical protein